MGTSNRSRQESAVPEQFVFARAWNEKIVLCLLGLDAEVPVRAPLSISIEMFAIPAREPRGVIHEGVEFGV